MLRTRARLDVNDFRPPSNFLTRSCDPISRYGKPVERMFKTDFIGPLHWFSVRTDVIARLCQKVDRGLFETVASYILWPLNCAPAQKDVLTLAFQSLMGLISLRLSTIPRGKS